ncbi:hypothetical protein ACQ4PT_000095 [Festuca glaucescens]
MEAVTTLLTVIQKIVKAAEKAHQNRARCLYLADRVDAVGDSLREDCDSTTGSGGGGAYSAGPQTVLVTMRPLGRLKAALDEAFELVESCRRRESGLVVRGIAVFTSESTAAKLQDVDTRITACVVDLGLAEQIATRHRDHRRRANEEAEPPQQQQPWPPSLQRLLRDYTPPAPPLPPFKQSKQPGLPSPQRSVELYTPSAPAPLPSIKQSRQAWPPSLERLLEQAAQPPPPPLPPFKQPLSKQLQRFLEQAAPRPQTTQQRCLTRSATPQQHSNVALPPVPPPEQHRYTTPSELLHGLS